jgi:hypothetical protein
MGGVSSDRKVLVSGRYHREVAIDTRTAICYGAHIR